MHSFIGAVLFAVTTMAVPIPQAPVPVTISQPPNPATVANDLLDGVCKPVTLIYARATNEPGNIGNFGQQLIASMNETLGASNLAVQGVDYPADDNGAVTGIIGGINPASTQGAQTQAVLTQQALQNCPQTKVVLGGYSQGAEQVHGAMLNLGPQGADISVCHCLTAQGR